MLRTYKLHAIFSDKAKAQSARDLMIKSGAFDRDQLVIVEVPTLVDTESEGVRARSPVARGARRAIVVCALGTAVALAGAGTGFMVRDFLPGASAVIAGVLAGGMGALLGMCGIPLLARDAPREARVPRGNWVLIAHAYSEREASLAEDMLASSRLSHRLRVRPNGVRAAMPRGGRPTGVAAYRPDHRRAAR